MKTTKTKWIKVSERPFNSDEKAVVSHAQVILTPSRIQGSSKKHLSAQFMMKTGGLYFIPVEPTKHEIGEIISMDNMLIAEFKPVEKFRAGDAEGWRISLEKNSIIRVIIKD